jgi:gamma-glutamyltranspeptidase/glutathione hydrolase
VEPVSTSYRGYELWELPPNTQGVIALEALNILEGYDFTAIEFGSTDHVHLLAEALKLAFEDGARYFADPDFAPAPIATLISKEYGAERRALIDRARAAKRYDAGGPFGAGDTVYLTVADAHGTMVSLIQSNYRGMGSGMVPPGLGFMLQDRGELFDLEPDRANTYAPGKRPFHTIIPAFVTKGGEPFMSFGVMGGSMQPQGHVQVLMNIVDFGMNLQEAGDAPRLRIEGHSEATGERMVDGGSLFLETGFDPAVMRDLAARGHRVSFSRDGYGGYQAIRWDAANRVWVGASESRKDGQAAGF